MTRGGRAREEGAGVDTAAVARFPVYAATFTGAAVGDVALANKAQDWGSGLGFHHLLGKYLLPGRGVVLPACNSAGTRPGGQVASTGAP